MDLIKTGAYLEFSEAFHPWLEIRNVIRGLGEQPKAEIQGPPLIIDLKDKKERTIIHVRAIELIFEQIESVNDGVSVIKQKLQSVNEVSTLPGSSLIRLDTVFIEIFAIPFHELLALMKKRFLSSNALMDAATDICLVLDEQDGPVLKHMQFGPMAKEQLLKQFVVFPHDDIPEVFSFQALSYERKMDFNIASDDFQNFLNDAVNWIDNQSKLITKFLKEGIA